MLVARSLRPSRPSSLTKSWSSSSPFTRCTRAASIPSSFAFSTTPTLHRSGYRLVDSTSSSSTNQTSSTKKLGRPTVHDRARAGERRDYDEAVMIQTLSQMEPREKIRREFQDGLDAMAGEVGESWSSPGVSSSSIKRGQTASSMNAES